MDHDALRQLTPEERERLDAAENEALQMLSRQMREGRWYPRRHMRVALVALVVLAGLILLVVSVFQR
ncbi:MAG: hypothetical protein M9921_08915 [Fimbriimonadaceae bacterium]|nr:hypothetical protein [Fimbriimonadaceae bacterium]